MTKSKIPAAKKPATMKAVAPKALDQQLTDYTGAPFGSIAMSFTVDHPITKTPASPQAKTPADVPAPVVAAPSPPNDTANLIAAVVAAISAGNKINAVTPQTAATPQTQASPEAPTSPAAATKKPAGFLKNAFLSAVKNPITTIGISTAAVATTNYFIPGTAKVVTNALGIAGNTALDITASMGNPTLILGISGALLGSALVAAQKYSLVKKGYHNPIEKWGGRGMLTAGVIAVGLSFMGYNLTSKNGINLALDDTGNGNSTLGQIFNSVKKTITGQDEFGNKTNNPILDANRPDAFKPKR